jgi:hypothetical protein
MPLGLLPEIQLTLARQILHIHSCWPHLWKSLPPLQPPSSVFFYLLLSAPPALIQPHNPCFWSLPIL